MPSEFQIIERWFSRCGRARSDVAVGVGDDCALLAPRAAQHLAITLDTLVEGVHFLPGSDPEDLGHKTLAVNLSDLAAMGAEPAWAVLGLTLPRAETSWLEAFSAGLCGLAGEHGVQLVGGDTTRGPLCLTLQLSGWVPEGAALRRSGASVGDLVCVTGTLGDAGLALAAIQGRAEVKAADQARLRARLNRPTPRVAEGMALRGQASAAIDVSDGLLADLGQLLAASGGLGAHLRLSALPLSRPVQRYIAATGDWSLPLSAGDDYELCFTLPPERRGVLRVLDARFPDTHFRIIGEVETGGGIRLTGPGGVPVSIQEGGYDHFR